MNFIRIMYLNFIILQIEAIMKNTFLKNISTLIFEQVYENTLKEEIV